MARPRSMRQSVRSYLLTLPAFAFLAIFFVGPLVVNLFESFKDGEGGLTYAQYVRALGDAYYLEVLGDTIVLSLAVTIASLVLGYPLALAIARSRGGLKSFLIFIVVTPLLINVVVRTFGWMVIFGRSGFLNSILKFMELDTITLTGTWTGIGIALVQVLLPFMVLSIASTLEGIDGELEDADWVTGLMDPKGMASQDGMLYVADATGMHVVSVADGSLVSTVALEGATFPNDIAVGADGSVYVTDFLAGGLYRYKDDVAEVFMPAGSLPLPNGILAADGTLWIGSFGEGMQPDFTVAEPGGLWKVDIESKNATPVEGAQGLGSVDGMVVVGDAVIFDDNPTGTMFVHDDAGTRELASVGEGAADLGVMGDIVIVPNLGTGEIVAYQYSPD